MFGNSLFGEADQDPFFAMHRQHMQRMNQMMADPFGMMGGGMAGAGMAGAGMAGAGMVGAGMAGAGMGMLPAPGTQPQHNRDYERRGDRRYDQATAIHPYMLLQQQQQQQQHQQQQLQQQALLQQDRRARNEVAAMRDPFFGGGGGNMFGHMNQMMSSMNSMMSNMHSQMGNTMQSAEVSGGPMYSHSTVMSYTNDGTGQPKVYQATKSTTQAPGGVREIKQSVRDSETGVAKMAIDRQIGDRRHCITKQKDLRTGDQEESHDYDNIDEEEASAFHQEFMQRGGGGGAARHPRSLGGSGQHRPRQPPSQRSIGYRERD